MMKCKKDICIATDGKDLQPALVLSMLDSLRRSASDVSEYRVHVLCDSGRESLTPDFLSFLDAFSDKSGLELNYYGCADAALSRFRFLRSGSRELRFPLASWYRFVAPEFIGAGRILYLDTDTLFHRDPSPIFDFDLGDAAFASVVDSLLTYNKWSLKWCLDKGFYSPLPPGGQYVADSIMLIDGKRFIDSGITGRMASAAEGVGDYARHDNNILALSVRPGECGIMPLKYHAPLYPLMSVESGWEGFANSLLERQGYGNKYAFFADAVTSQMQGDKRTRYFDDPVLGPLLRERVSAVRHYCFPDWY